jgi:DNA-binding transcriptional LysR family regulator
VGSGLAGTVRVGVTPAIGRATREEVVRVLRDDAAELSVSFHEVRPREMLQVLRDRTVDLVLARTSRDTPEIDSAPLRPSAVELVVPADHRLASRAAARLAELDGERLLTWSAPGTPYTDLLLTRLRAAGARVEPVESRITGGGDPPELTEAGAVALVPAGWPIGERNVRLTIEDDISLPLLVLWLAGLSLPAVGRLRAGMGTKS